MGAVCCSPKEIDFGEEVELAHFHLLRVIGKGAFGKVRVVQHKGSKQLYALKYIKKSRCIELQATHNIISERRLLEQIDHPLIVNLRYAFQDSQYLFMVIDLMLGGDLRFHLDRLGVMPEQYVKFYAAEIAWSLRYLHRKNIIHRDLKPDNILLNEQGHVHLTDFNIAVQFNESKPLTSVAGSMAYMAPEVLQKKGYFASVDWWSLGVVCYELMIGKRPFRGKTNEALQHAIMHDNVVFPETSHISNESRDFIKGLLTRDVNKRLGHGEKGFRRLMAHPWLQHIQWELMDSKQVTPPFIPDSKRANFDPTHELEEILLEDNPLKVRKRNPKRSAASGANGSLKSHGSDAALSTTSPEQQLMDEKFITFDFTKPEENERRKMEMEQQRWTQRMAKTNASPTEKNRMTSPPRGSSRKPVTGTYNTSVVDYINQQPATPLSASDILKMEELERMKRTQALTNNNTNNNNNNILNNGNHTDLSNGIQSGNAKEKRNLDWRPPSGILASNTSLVDNNNNNNNNPLQAVQVRDDYILQAGGTPPPMKPPGPVMISSSDRTISNNVRQLHKPSISSLHQHSQPQRPYPSQLQHTPPPPLRRRSSSDSSYHMASSPENLHRPLMQASTSSIVTNMTNNTVNQQHIHRIDSPVPPQKWMFDSNTLPPIPTNSSNNNIPMSTTSPHPAPTHPPPPPPPIASSGLTSQPVQKRYI